MTLSSIWGVGDGTLWFTEFDVAANRIGHVSLNGEIHEYPVPTRASNPAGITVAPDGIVWFVENSGHHVARLKPVG